MQDTLSPQLATRAPIFVDSERYYSRVALSAYMLLHCTKNLKQAMINHLHMQNCVHVDGD